MKDATCLLAGSIRNAHIVAPGLRIHVVGKPNKFTHSGRPKNLFAPKSSRIIRQLLIESSHAFTQRELTKDTGVDEALVSRLVRELEREAQNPRRSRRGAARKIPIFCSTLGMSDTRFASTKSLRGSLQSEAAIRYCKAYPKSLKKYGVKYAEI